MQKSQTHYHDLNYMLCLESANRAKSAPASELGVSEDHTSHNKTK